MVHQVEVRVEVQVVLVLQMWEIRIQPTENHLLRRRRKSLLSVEVRIEVRVGGRVELWLSLDGVEV